jgi:uncharacterized protein YegJ (DUF2314 family)
MRLSQPLLVLALTLLVAGTAFGQKRDENEVLMISRQDRDMAAAIRNSRASLDTFLQLAQNPPPEVSGLKLKVMVTDPNGTEHFWVTPFKPTATGFEGTLANEPRIVKSVKHGQLLTFSRADISDWGYVKDGRQIGSFTICVMLKQAPKEQADYYRKNYGFDC